MAKCTNCQQAKVEHLKPCCLTQIIEVSTCKWEAINMVFVVGLPRSRRQHDSIWVIVEILSKSAQFIPLMSTNRGEDYARLILMRL